MTFARHQFTLSEPQDDGAPLVAHLEAFERATGQVHELLVDPPKLPDGCARLWEHFLELHGCRGSTGWGPQRITYTDIDAYQRVTGAKLRSHELDCIRQADNIWLTDFAPKPKGDQ